MSSPTSPSLRQKLFPPRDGKLSLPASPVDYPPKGILKRSPYSSSLSARLDEKTIYEGATNSTPECRTIKFQDGKKIQAPSSTNCKAIKQNRPSKIVGFAAKNAIAIFGETSDELETEVEGNVHVKGERKAMEPSIRQSTAHNDVVTVEEINKTALEKRLRCENSPEMEVASTSDATSTSTSHIFGKWWTGKSTKFVLHCDKRGCRGRDDHSHSASDYMTPTQRKNREIEALKKELKYWQENSEERQKEIECLREKLEEQALKIEIIQSRDIAEDSSQQSNFTSLEEQLQAMTKKLETQFENEVHLIQERYENQIRHMAHVESDLRDELARKQRITLNQRVETLNKEQKNRDNWTMTVEINELSNQSKSNESLPKLEYESENEMIPSPPMARSTENISEPNPQECEEKAAKSENEDPDSRAKNDLHVALKFQAYENELLAWRTKCAQFELVLRDMILKSIPVEVPLNVDHNGTKSKEKEPQSSVSNKESSNPENSTISRVPSQSTIPSQPTVAECQFVACREKKRQLNEENYTLREQLAGHSEQIEKLRVDVANGDVKSKRSKMELNELKSDYEELAALAEKRLAETQVLHLETSHLKNDKERLEKAISYVETQCQMLQNVLIEHGLVVELDRNLELNHAIPNPHFSVKTSQDIQTQLTMDALFADEQRIGDLESDLKVTEEELKETKQNAVERIDNLENNLIVKTKLVDDLTEQLEGTLNSAQKALLQHQHEKEMFLKKIDELVRITERVPVLEQELEIAIESKSKCELKLQEVIEEKEDDLEKVLDSQLQKAHAHEQYWLEKVESLEKSRKEASILLQQLHQRFKDAQMANQLERTELEQRLHSSINHIALLNNKLNCPRRDAQCEVKPKTSNKFVSCRPNNKEKSTAIEKGELPPDYELANCRRGLEAAVDRIIELQDELKRAESRKKSKSKSRDRVVFERAKDEVVLFDEEDEISILSSPTIICGHNDEIDDEFDLSNKLMKQHRHSLAHWNSQKNSQTPEEDFFDNIPSSQERSPPKSTDIGTRSTPPMIVLENSEVEQKQLLTPELKVVSDLDIPCLQQQQQITIPYLASIKEEIRSIIRSQNDSGREFVKVDGELEKLFGLILQGQNGDTTFKLKNELKGLREKAKELLDALKYAEMELEVYRMEPRESITQQHLMGRKWTSAEDLNPPNTHECQLKRWKEIAGTTFREVNRLRHEFAEAETDRLNSKNQLAILKGELVMLKFEKKHKKLQRERNQQWLHNFKQNPEQIYGHVEGVNPYYNRWLGNRWQSVPDVNEFTIDTVELKTHKTNRVYGSRRSSSLDRRNRISTKNSERRLLVDKTEQALPTFMKDAIQQQVRTITTLRQQNAKLESEVDELLEKMEAEKRLAMENSEQVRSISTQIKDLVHEGAILRSENEMYEKKIKDVERERQQMYLIMFKKGQQAGTLEAREDAELDQLSEDRAILRFLHDAFYYYLSNKGNSKEHLQAIMTMLDFTNEQKEDVYKRRGKSQ